MQSFRCLSIVCSLYSIGYAIARRLGLDGASVMISSRKQQNVQQAVEKLKEENITVAGTVCHVGKQEHRTQLIQEASFIVHCMVHACTPSILKTFMTFIVLSYTV